MRRLDAWGQLPARALAALWELARATGEVTAPLPEARFLDRRFMATLPQWAPP